MSAVHEARQRIQENLAIDTRLSVCKGSASKANLRWLQDRGIGDLIQHKGSAGKPVHPLLKVFNSKIGSIRFKVEQAFGMKRRFHLARARLTASSKAWRWQGLVRPEKGGQRGCERGLEAKDRARARKTRSNFTDHSIA